MTYFSGLEKKVINSNAQRVFFFKHLYVFHERKIMVNT